MGKSALFGLFQISRADAWITSISINPGKNVMNTTSSSFSPPPPPPSLQCVVWCNRECIIETGTGWNSWKVLKVRINVHW